MHRTKEKKTQKKKVLTQTKQKNNDRPGHPAPDKDNCKL